MDTHQAAPPAKPTITLHLVETPEGVLIRADGDLAAVTPQANVARTLCRFADGLYEASKPVRLGPEIVKAAL